MSNLINIAIIDNSITWRHILSSLLEDNKFFVALKCNDEYEFLNDTHNLKVDIIIIDINLSNKNGIEVLQLLKLKFPEIPIIIYSLISELLVNQTFYNLGVYKCIYKNNYNELEQEIYRILKLENKRQTFEIELTKQELELLTLICNDLDKYEISERMFISLSSYEKKGKSLAEKLHVKNTSAALIIWAFKHNIIK